MPHPLRRVLSATLKFAAPLLTLIPSLARAAGGEGGHGAAGGHHTPHVTNWFNFGAEWAYAPALGWLFVTFFVFCGIVVYFVRKPLANFLESRSESVRKALAEAQQARSEAESKARDYETRLSRLDDEIAALRKEFVERGEAEEARLAEVGAQTAERIAKDAEDTIPAETERAQVMLGAEAARLAVALAEKKIISAASTADDARLHSAFLADLSAEA